MAADKRPLSPHLHIYRLQLTSILSVLHRITGIVLALAVVPIAWWFVAIAGGESSYFVVQTFFTSWFGIWFLSTWTFCIFYHLCNGVRHLFWDFGIGLELTQLYLSGKMVIAVSIILTVLVWFLYW